MLFFGIMFGWSAVSVSTIIGWKIYEHKQEIKERRAWSYKK